MPPSTDSDSPGNEGCNCSWDCTEDKLPVSASVTRPEYFPSRTSSPLAIPATTRCSPRPSRPEIKLSLTLSSASQTPIPPVLVGLPSPIACTPASPVPSFSSSRKLRNAKQLSLFVPSNGSGRRPPTPASDDAQSPTGLDITETRSLPSTPRLAINTANGANDSVDEEMLDPQSRGELTSALKGTMTMKRRTSLPRLSISVTRSLAIPTQDQSKSTDIPPTPSIATSRGLPLPLTVENLVARNREAGAPVAANSAEAHEEFPYQHGPKEILPGLFLGSEQNAKDPALLRAYGISTVLCVAKEVACPWLHDCACPDISEAEEDEVEDSSPDSEREPDLCSNTHRTAQSLSRCIPANAEDSLQPPRGSPSRPFLIRSSASTPNLQQGFRKTAANAASGSLLEIVDQTSPNHCAAASSTPIRASSPHPGYIYKRFAANRLSGRPALSYTKLPWGHDEDDIATHFSTYNICDLIDKATADGGRCLVHCQLGVSRSATLMIGYCMRQACLGKEEALKDVKTMHETYSYVRAKSRWVAPNIGLLAQLVQLERVLAASTSCDSSMPYTNSAYYDSQLSLASSSSPDNLSPCSTSESELDSRLSTPESRSRFRTHAPHCSDMAVDQQLSPLTAAIHLSPAVESFSSSERKREHRKTFSTDFPTRLSIVVKPVLTKNTTVA